MQTSTLEIDILQLLKKLWSRKFLILLIALIGAAIGLLISLFIITPEYKSTTRLYVVNQSSGTDNLTVQDIQAGGYLVNDYKEIITSEDVLTQVIEKEGLAMTPSKLSSKVSVTIPNETRVISINVMDENAGAASDIANSLREVASEKIKAVTNVEDVTTLEAAKPANSPSTPNTKRNILLGFVVGLFLSTIAILLLEVLDDRIKSPEDVEEQMKLTLLGIVPDINRL
ncbi:Wzz/FepE/Etk N-terminal domain-containing protein [Streptococcus thoraltensis]|uniref:Wzz/FepE/Etk N-terminal domain-containing protein n=1 Tax=Streptococcus thoraltensis TaxID=55085 RepID=UPI00036D5B81|nr:Wzz/FepE/Etk N-terminal domain-containing protein [Streptococcus thoraltensis]MDY4760927.1 Wzz/FepE/Etk N-terminal domain-containing protein [Streptococcus thoraltensis]